MYRDGHWFPMFGYADDGFGNLIEVKREPFELHPEPLFPGEKRATGPYAWLVSDWLFRDIGACCAS